MRGFNSKVVNVVSGVRISLGDTDFKSYTFWQCDSAVRGDSTYY